MSFHTMYVRQRGSKDSGGAFTDLEVEQVWRKGTPIPGYSPDVWRHDTCGHPIKRTDYGNTATKFGWEVDHIRPVAAGGTSNLSNLQPLYWETNRQKGDKYPWSCGQ
jgi:hypothetical protein